LSLPLYILHTDSSLSLCLGCPRLFNERPRGRRGFASLLPLGIYTHTYISPYIYIYIYICIYICICIYIYIYIHTAVLPVFFFGMLAPRRLQSSSVSFPRCLPRLLQRQTQQTSTQAGRPSGVRRPSRA